MSRRHTQGPQSARKGLHNLDYLEQKMNQNQRPIVDAMGLPAGQAQQQVQSVPIVTFWVGRFEQAMAHYLATMPNPVDAVANAKVFADEAFAVLGFRYLGNLQCEPIKAGDANLSPEARKAGEAYQ